MKDDKDIVSISNRVSEKKRKQKLAKDITKDMESRYAVTKKMHENCSFIQYLKLLETDIEHSDVGSATQDELARLSKMDPNRRAQELARVSRKEKQVASPRLKMLLSQKERIEQDIAKEREKTKQGQH